MALSVDRLFIYPVKSLRPVEVKAVEITSEGLRFDRIFVLVFPPTAPDQLVAEHLTIKKHYGLVLFQPEIDDTWSRLTIRHLSAPATSFVTVPLVPAPFSLLNVRQYQVSIFGTTALGMDVGDSAAQFFSQHLHQNVRLLFIGGSGRREIPGSAYIPNQLNAVSLSLNGLQKQRIRFADAAPLLITSSASEEDLRSRLPTQHRGEDIILRLRPNIHVNVGDTLPAWDEDTWSTLSVATGPQGLQKVVIKCIFRCVRCLSLNVDPDTGQMIERDRQLYGYLAKDRRVNERFPHKPVFGQYAFAGPEGAMIRVGDRIDLVERTNASQ